MSSSWIPEAPTPRRPLPGANPRQELLSGVALVIDASGSTNAIDDGGTLRRFDRQASVVRNVLSDAPRARVVVFGDQVRELTGIEPETALQGIQPAGSTPLAGALSLVAVIRPQPERVIVLSDGLPDDAAAALAIARTLKPSIIDALYIGPDGNKGAIAFMKALSLMGGRGGTSGHRSLAGPEAAQALTDEIKLLISGPASGPRG